ncbi:MAG: hypothetical protein SGCHY_001503 [Lobulomycetales sp.]
MSKETDTYGRLCLSRFVQRVFLKHRRTAKACFFMSVSQEEINLLISRTSSTSKIKATTSGMPECKQVLEERYDMIKDVADGGHVYNPLLVLRSRDIPGWAFSTQEVIDMFARDTDRPSASQQETANSPPVKECQSVEDADGPFDSQLSLPAKRNSILHVLGFTSPPASISIPIEKADSSSPQQQGVLLVTSSRPGSASRTRRASQSDNSPDFKEIQKRLKRVIMPSLAPQDEDNQSVSSSDTRDADPRKSVMIKPDTGGSAATTPESFLRPSHVHEKVDPVEFVSELESLEEEFSTIKLEMNELRLERASTLSTSALYPEPTIQEKLKEFERWLSSLSTDKTSSAKTSATILERNGKTRSDALESMQLIKDRWAKTELLNARLKALEDKLAEQTNRKISFNFLTGLWYSFIEFGLRIMGTVVWGVYRIGKMIGF